jgi:hypothetical protein
MRIPYYCPYCDQRSTRRWNLEIHIKRRHGEYLLGRSSGRYLASKPFSYEPNYPYHNIGSATVADSVGETFQSRYIPQQAPLDVMQYSASPIYRPPATMDDQSFGTGLSHETKLKIEELKRLMYKYSQYLTNPNGIIKWAIYWSIKGDNKPLDEKLEQLRRIDSLAGF